MSPRPLSHHRRHYWLSVHWSFPSPFVSVVVVVCAPASDWTACFVCQRHRVATVLSLSQLTALTIVAMQLDCLFSKLMSPLKRGGKSEDAHNGVLSCTTQDIRQRPVKNEHLFFPTYVVESIRKRFIILLPCFLWVETQHWSVVCQIVRIDLKTARVGT